ncbi:MAG: response regulator [Deltaproteobacteria bacterium]|nr:response regulator [Deltaproteobacteria bacterium]
MTSIRTILLVDDDSRLRDLYGGVLRRAGYTVTDAENGAQAIACLRDSGFDLVLMDVNMPVMDGLDATRHIRKNAQTRATTVIALTSNAMPEEVAKGLDAGCDGYIVKPLDPEELLRELDAILVTE